MVVGRMGVAVAFLCFLTLFESGFGAEHVPVLLWESSEGDSTQGTTIPSLMHLSSDEFSDYFLKKVATHNSNTKPTIVVFAEESLSMEDFSWEDVDKEISFPQLQNLTHMASRVDFLPAVHAPLKGLKRLGYHWQPYTENNDTENHLPNEDGVIFLVKLDDAKVDEDRPDLLRRHDRMISDIYSHLLSKYVNIIALYTSHHASWIEPEDEPSVRRVRRLLASEPSEIKTFWHDKDNSILLYSPMYVTVNTESEPSKAINLVANSSLCNSDNRTNMQRLICKFSINSTLNVVIRLRFRKTESNYWSFPEVEHEENGVNTILKTTSDIYAPIGFSYHCGSPIIFKNDSVTLTFSNVQMQPYMKELRFGDAYDCVWFFTAPIWSALFVTAMLALIMIWGLSMILDIKTMDQFDDPKGKTITISASD